MAHTTPEFPFTPVPVRARRDGWTPERQRRFIELLRLKRRVSGAAREVGSSRESAYRLRERPGAESFAAAWDAALAESASLAGPGVFERAFAGEVVPVLYRGRKVGDRRKRDSRAALAILRAYFAVRARRRERKETARRGEVSPSGQTS